MYELVVIRVGVGSDLFHLNFKKGNSGSKMLTMECVCMSQNEDAGEQNVQEDV